MNSVVRHAIFFALAAAVASAAVEAQTNRQIVSAQPVVQSALPGETFTVRFLYSTDPPTSSLTGLGLRLHWDDSALQLLDVVQAPDQPVHSFRGALLQTRSDELADPDQNPDNRPTDLARDFDGNPATDSYRVLAWADAAGDWPGTSEEIALAQAEFMVRADFDGVTVVGLSATSTPVGWSFRDVPATITTDPDGLPPPELNITKTWLPAADNDGHDDGVVFGGDAFFRIEVGNPGLLGIDDVSVSDPSAPDCDRDLGRLLADESATWTCSKADVQSSFINEIAATGSALDGGDGQVSADDQAEVTVVDPAVGLTVTPPQQTIRHGEPATFDITVSNESDSSFNELEVVAEEVADCELSIADLPPGEQVGYDCTASSLEQDLLNEVEVLDSSGDTADPTLLNRVVAEVIVIEPALELIKSAHPASVEVGGDVLFNLELTNIGDSEITDINVVDDLVPDCDRDFTSLQPNAAVSWTCEASGVEEDFVNNATATGQPPVGAAVHSSDDAAVTTFVLLFADGFEEPEP